MVVGKKKKEPGKIFRVLELVETAQIQPEIHTMKAPICKLIITIHLTKKESKVCIYVLV